MRFYTIGILLWEFATGTGIAERDFYQGKHPFADQFLTGYVLNNIFEDINTGLTKDKFTTYKNISSRFYNIAIPFSPTINPSSWGGSVAKHISF